MRQSILHSKLLNIWDMRQSILYDKSLLVESFGRWNLTGLKTENVTLEDCRNKVTTLVSYRLNEYSKADSNAAKIRERLNLMGVPHVSKLKTNQIQTFYNFLKTL